MRKQRVLRAFLITSALMGTLASQGASAATVTFSGLSGARVSMPTYTEAGVTTTSVQGDFWGFPSAGQLHMDPSFFNNAIYDFTFGGSPFALNSLDISFASTGAVGTFTAFDASDNLLGTTAFSGGTLGTIDFTGTAGFDNISRLRLVDTVSHFSIDNLVLTPSADTGAVPEPSTWAMMLVGFGAIGVAMRRRQQRSTVAFAF